jgi:hypothetical protein
MCHTGTIIDWNSQWSVREGYIALIQLIIFLLYAWSWWNCLLICAFEKYEVTSHLSPCFADGQGYGFLRCKPWNLVRGYGCWWGTCCVKYSYSKMNINFNYQSCEWCANTRNIHIHKFWIFNWLMLILIMYQVHVTYVERSPYLVMDQFRDVYRNVPQICWRLKHVLLRYILQHGSHITPRAEVWNCFSSFV